MQRHPYRALEDHAEDGRDHHQQRGHLLPLRHRAEIIACGGHPGGGLLAAHGQQAVTEEGEVEDATDQQRQADLGIFEEAEFESDILQGALRDEVARRADQRKIAAHRRRKHQWHQQPRA
ncbi:hypothetical protein D3C78_1237790 [compost metagenome]